MKSEQVRDNGCVQGEKSLLRWERWEPRRGRSIRRRPDPELGEILQRELMEIAPAISIVCGATSVPMRLVGCAAYRSATRAGEKLHELQLAKHALDQLSRNTQERIRNVSAHITTGCGSIPSGVRRLHGNNLSRPQPTVFMVVNDPSLYCAAQETLSPFGFEVKRMSGSDLTEDTIGQESPALVILDVLTHDGDGISFTLDLVHRCIPVVLLCSIPVEPTSPALVFLQRKFDREMLLAAVYRALG